MVGFIANIIYMKVVINGNRKFLDLAHDLTLQIRDAHQHPDYGRVQALFSSESSGLFFNWIPSQWSPMDLKQSQAPRETRHTDALRILPYPIDIRSAECDKLFQFMMVPSDAADGIVMTIFYRSDMFNSSEIESFIQCTRLLSTEVVNRPTDCVNTYALPA